MTNRPTLRRSFDLLDIEIQRGGDGRTVTAYAATFGDPYEVHDQEGHYFEQIHPHAFNRAIGRGVDKVSVFYNHGRTIDGKSPVELSIPIGVPLEIRADARGLITVTRYGLSTVADEVLEAIRDGRIKGQSFHGQIFENGPTRQHPLGLDLVERKQLGLIEYGPTPSPMNVGAEMVSIRSNTPTPEETYNARLDPTLAALNTERLRAGIRLRR